MEQEQNQQKLVPAVERAAGILDVIATAKRYLTVSELARETALPKSTVHNLCSTLVQLGLLIRRPDQTYLLGPHLLRWSNAFDRQTDVAAEFAALWDQRDIPQEAVVSLGVPEKGEIVFIAARQSAGGHRFSVRPGLRLPAPFVAAGQAVLAHASDYEVRRLFADGYPKPLTERSAGTLSELLETLATIRKHDYAIEEEQCQAGITSLGAAVLNSLNRPLAAVMISVPAELFRDEVREELAEVLLDITRSLSRRMGADLDSRRG